VNILEQIIAAKKVEVAERKRKYPIAELVQQPLYQRNTFSISQNIRTANGIGIIAEFKRKSPSKGIINGTAQVEDVAKAYAAAGVSAISVLTDEIYFGAYSIDFALARKSVAVPLLRKDFIIDAYQVHETKAMGADVMLLIAANLEVAQCHELAALAKSIGLEVLLELHTEQELDYINDSVDLVGINNRNLKTFEVDLDHSIRLAAQIPNQFIKIAESGISDIQNILLLQKAGFQGFLIGENFMKTSSPGAACQNFIQQLKHEN
jgi:indole-3-glycerol phosphate synthase